MNLEMKRFYVALGLSLIFHLFQIGLVNSIPAQNGYFITETPIELIESESPSTPEEKNQKKIAPIPKVNSVANNDPAQFFAEQSQRVEKETATRNTGITNNQTSTPSPRNAPQKRPSEPNNELGDEPEFAKAIRPITGNASPSALEFQLPSDIAEGTATNLNTDAHIYASFYNRVTELFYIRWAQRLDTLWSRMSTETKLSLSGRVWQTDIEVWLKPTGEYHKSFIMKPSGFQNFDQAAIFAFQNARFFPNPPKAKVEPDGFVRLRYRIGVHVR